MDFDTVSRLNVVRMCVVDNKFMKRIIMRGYKQSALVYHCNGGSVLSHLCSLWATLTHNIVENENCVDVSRIYLVILIIIIILLLFLKSERIRQHLHPFNIEMTLALSINSLEFVPMSY